MSHRSARPGDRYFSGGKHPTYCLASATHFRPAAPASPTHYTFAPHPMVASLAHPRRPRMLWLQLPLLLALLAWVLHSASAQGTPPPAREAPVPDEATLDAQAADIATADGSPADGSPADGSPGDSLGVPVELARLDWAGLKRFAEANRALPPKAPGESRVVFLGNSITEGWEGAYPELFARHPNWLNRGISGQTTEQMLVRFRPDVIDIGADVVVIAAGIHDIAANPGFTPPERTLGNFASMCELAAANDVDVIVESILPAYAFAWRPTMASPAQKVVALNEMLEAYAKTQDHVTYLDVFSVLADERPGMRPGMSYDEVHLTREGYEAVAPVIEAALAGR